MANYGQYGYPQYQAYNTYPQYQQAYPQYQQQAAQPQQMNQPIQNPQQMQQMQQATQQPQIQNGGFVSVRGIEEAQNYPVAPGNSITFKDENAPYVYTKTMGFSQLDRPVFEKYRLVKEEDVPKAKPAHQETAPSEKREMPDYALKSDLKGLYDQLDILRNELDFLKKSRKSSPKKKQEIAVEEKEIVEEVTDNE